MVLRRAGPACGVGRVYRRVGPQLPPVRAERRSAEQHAFVMVVGILTSASCRSRRRAGLGGLRGGRLLAGSDARSSWAAVTSALPTAVQVGQAGRPCTCSTATGSTRCVHATSTLHGSKYSLIGAGDTVAALAQRTTNGKRFDGAGADPRRRIVEYARCASGGRSARRRRRRIGGPAAAAAPRSRRADEIQQLLAEHWRPRLARRGRGRRPQIDSTKKLHAIHAVLAPSRANARAWSRRRRRSAGPRAAEPAAHPASDRRGAGVGLATRPAPSRPASARDGRLDRRDASAAPTCAGRQHEAAELRRRSRRHLTTPRVTGAHTPVVSKQRAMPRSPRRQYEGARPRSRWRTGRRPSRSRRTVALPCRRKM